MTSTAATAPRKATTRATGRGPDLGSWTFWQTIGGVVIEPVVRPPANLRSLVAASAAVARGRITSIRPAPQDGGYGRVLVTVTTARGSVDVVLLHPLSVSAESLRQKLPPEEVVFFLSPAAGDRGEWNCSQ